ncbi:hypothetical protein II906_07500 [bacterium]|nr:hypothetical protein [bacterium]
MAEGKDPRLAGLEQSLINFLSQKKEVDEKVPGGIRRVRGLNLNFDLRDERRPCFTVQIGMFEAAFNALNGYKERGNCFGIERLIVDWFQRPSVKNEFKMILNMIYRSSN